MRTKAQPEFTIDDIRKAFHEGQRARILKEEEKRERYQRLVQLLREKRAS